MSTIYPLKVQAIRSRGQQARLYVYFPLPLAAAIGLEAGEEVQWELLDRGELHLLRRQVAAPAARTRSGRAGAATDTLSAAAPGTRRRKTQ
ncbi:MAG: hypothetical protein M5U12_05090 [Verrucomicrobia bacterium]|nr:hypothetical protein [Verrucomicrobiota bacterium]